MRGKFRVAAHPVKHEGIGGVIRMQSTSLNPGGSEIFLESRLEFRRFDACRLIGCHPRTILCWPQALQPGSERAWGMQTPKKEAQLVLPECPAGPRGRGPAQYGEDAVLRVHGHVHEFPSIRRGRVEPILGVRADVRLHYHIFPGARRVARRDERECDNNHGKKNSGDQALKIKRFHVESSRAIGGLNSGKIRELRAWSRELRSDAVSGPGFPYSSSPRKRRPDYFQIDR